MAVNNTKLINAINNIKGYIANAIKDKADKSELPTKVSDLDNDSGYLTQHNPIDSALSSSSENAVQNKVIKDALDDKADASSLATVATSGSYTDLSNKPSIPADTNDLTNGAGFITASDIEGKADSADLATVATSGSYDDLSDKPTLADLEGVVSVEKQQTAETGYAATYVVKQNDTQVGAKINIPKDFLVKSGEVKTAAAADLSTLGQGYTSGDKYIDFVINTKDGSGTDEHMYINVKDLVEDTTYTADESTITLSNDQFSVKAGGIGTTQLSSGVNTSLGYADDWNSSAAKGIASTDITAWNAKPTMSEVDSEINDVLDAIANGFDTSA